MTTFTTEDRIFTAQYPWPDPWANAKDYRQAEIEFFFPLTEQIPLDLDYGPTHLHFRAKGIAGVQSMPIRNSIYEFTTVASNPVSPSITITPTNSVGNLNLGGVSIGMNEKPKWYRRALYKLLGFNWKDR
jgi:hypothetical protein